MYIALSSSIWIAGRPCACAGYLVRYSLGLIPPLLMSLTISYIPMPAASA